MSTPTEDSAEGFAFAAGSYAIWGAVFPLYMKLLDRVPAPEIVSHRILWAVPFAALILLVAGKLGDALRLFRSPRRVALAALTATLITLNWGVYVYAIVSNQGLEAALGYYINPLLNVVIAAVFLRERPSRLQWMAVGLATLAVIMLTVKAGGLPWISLVLALTFGSYGLLRKLLPVGATEGFFVEVVLLSVPAGLYVLWLGTAGNGHFLGETSRTALLVGAGPLTAVPLILFAAGARRLSFSTLGILQYLVPTLLFVMAVFVFGEPFSTWQLAAFALIWTGVGFYIWSLLALRRERRRAALRPLPS
ncbi:EamA family transporter RarD [Aurantimonas sp. MSK8Z-1]|uniref:EamA family transporter RarD n=1 Tax=Mangrovibrevibacter kandeliae TaxID=2968473 RepID=UPI002117C198|nr:EamA family transporter RarD [Aurantimonas sp. MSK8Z-1]MCW4113944.1 EamA family transporter RarD [Aurantimonas sp. MSK8Z-1]